MPSEYNGMEKNTTEISVIIGKSFAGALRYATETGCCNSSSRYEE